MCGMIQIKNNKNQKIHILVIYSCHGRSKYQNETPCIMFLQNNVFKVKNWSSLKWVGVSKRIKRITPSWWGLLGSKYSWQKVRLGIKIYNFTVCERWKITLGFYSNAQPKISLHSRIICHMNRNFVSFQNMCKLKRSDLQ